MTTIHENSDDRGVSPFAMGVQLEARDSEVLFAVLDRVACAAGHEPWGGGVSARVSAVGAAFRRRLSPSGWGEAPTGVPGRWRAYAPREAVLDLAADLLELSDQLLDRGRPLEALALEGIEGRLLEALLGSGRHDDTAGHQRR